MRILRLGSGDDFVPNSFITQYISIILIIITCIIYAFFTRTAALTPAGKGIVAEQKASGGPDGPEAPVAPHVQLGRELATLSVSELFLPDSNLTVDNEAGEAYVQILSNHDVNADFEIHLSDGQFDRGFRMTRSLEDYFRERGVPQSAVKVFMLPMMSADAVIVRLRTSPGGARAGSMS